MMKSAWSGAIGFGLVNIPVKLYPAVQSSRLDLDMLDGRDQARIRYLRVNERTHKEVPFDKIVKGYKLNDRYVVLDEEDFKEAAPERSSLIEIENFVGLDEINPMFFETSWYAAPQKADNKAYALLVKSLLKVKKAGLARFVLRNNESLCIIYPVDNVIVATRIRFAQEIRNSDEITIDKDVTVSKKEIDVAVALIKQFSAKFDISKFRDEYDEELLKLIKQKAKGKRATVKKFTPRHSETDDLFEQLMKSLDAKKGA